MSEQTTSASGGAGFFSLLCILFIGLKLTGYIGWSWWWVLSPIWLPLSVALLVILIAAIFFSDR